MLNVTIPDNFPAERNYIIQVLMTGFLGIDINVTSSNISHCTISDDIGKELILTDVFFSVSESEWLTPASLPIQPLQIWDLANSSIGFSPDEKYLPIIFGKTVDLESYLVVEENKIQLGLDIFGSAFFMLTRYEEYVNPKRDKLDRFPPSEALAYQEGFLQRPIINEYLEILWHLLNRLWPQLSRKSRSYQVHLSHDVDEPFYAFIKNPKRIIGSLYADIAKRKEPLLAVGRAASIIGRGGAGARFDPFDTFSFLMDISEQHGWRSAFYFMASEPIYDPDNRYDLQHPKVRELLQRIAQRGHEIGLHPSMDSYQNSMTIAREYKMLCKVLAEENISQDSIGGRQHYLRWSNPATWQIWNDTGLAYDTTLNFAEDPGFRCGICYEYPVFNLEERVPLSLMERPLIVMERFYQRNSAISHKQAREIVHGLAKICRSYNGLMTILWHNNALMTRNDKSLYRSICEDIS